MATISKPKAVEETTATTKTITKKAPKAKLVFTPGQTIGAQIENVMPLIGVNEVLPLPKEELKEALKDIRAVSAEREEVLFDEVKSFNNVVYPAINTQSTKSTYNDNDNKGYKSESKTTKPYDKRFSPATGNYPTHMVELAFIVHHNAEIRRFTALGILNYLMQKGEIKRVKSFVDFKWDKFTVKTDNLIKEYSFTEPFFLNCLVASFTSFAASAQKTITKFADKELNNYKGVELFNDEAISNIVNSVSNRPQDN